MKRVLVFIVCAGFVAEKDIPEIKSVTTLPNGILVEWTWQGDDDIDGFKIKIWEVQSVDQGYFNLVNGDEIPGLLLNRNALEPFNKEKVPKATPRTIVTTNSGVREIKIDNIKYNILYEIRVLPYERDEEGPASGPSRIRLIKADEVLNVVAAQMNEELCIATVATNITLSGETYYHLRNIYF